MALNKFMHPRNIYKKKKPDFVQLALKYPDFQKHSIQDLNGKVTLDFKNPESVRVLTQTLLKEDFNLDVDLPNDRLVPTLSSRLNYIHWIEDMFAQKDLHGIDIGTGASCIYPLLSCKMNNWSFLAVEVDDKNYEFAVKNVKSNNMEDRIKVQKVRENTGILELDLDNDITYDFLMCNPPFFADHMEAQAVTTTRKDDRPNPSSSNTAEDIESIVQGGEATFITKMIEDSFNLRHKIRVFSSMVGKKINVSVIKEDLKKKKVSNFATTEFCQGKTMRWGIAWTYDSTVNFPKSHFEKKKKKGLTPLVYEIPFDNGQVLYDIQNITAFIIQELEHLKIEYKEGKRNEQSGTITMTAKQNTWSHQRQKRRREKYAQLNTSASSEELTASTDCQNTESMNSSEKIAEDTVPSTSEENTPENKKPKLDDNSQTSKIPSCPLPIDTHCLEDDFYCKDSNIKDLTDLQSRHTSESVVLNPTESKAEDKSPDYLVKCRIILRKKDNVIEMEIVDLDKKREMANQILQYFKNKLKSVT